MCRRAAAPWSGSPRRTIKATSTIPPRSGIRTFWATRTSSAIPPALLAGTPTAVWQTISTEVPFAPTLLKGQPVENTQGLFMVLMQRANRVVRNLTGRFLGVRIQLNGDGRNSPQIAGLRVYGPRFSYVQKYLPEIYHEGKFPPASDARRRQHPARLSRALRRSLRIAVHPHRRPHCKCVSADASREHARRLARMAWLLDWHPSQPELSAPPPPRPPGGDAQPLPVARHREGRYAALDVATDGACTRGAIIVIEDFRLRHIFATILGANLAVEDNPAASRLPAGQQLVCRRHALSRRSAHAGGIAGALRDRP